MVAWAVMMIGSTSGSASRTRFMSSRPVRRGIIRSTSSTAKLPPGVGPGFAPGGSPGFAPAWKASQPAWPSSAMVTW
jgi:hypothetical protein